MNERSPGGRTSESAARDAFDREAFASSLHARLKKRDQVSVAQILDVLKDLVLDEKAGLSAEVTPRLAVRRLRFTGVKRLRDGTTCPIAFDQRFSDGVNILLIERNNAGKSTVLKTILFALTGNREAYDADVRSWIEQIWLTFMLGDASFTVAIDARDRVRAILVLDEVTASVDDLVARAGFVFRAESQEELARELEHFFFSRLGLVELRWLTSQAGDGLSESRTSWRTYAQAFHFDADVTDYLLCDQAHSYGNQEGLIFSAYLGLQYAEALNQLGVEKSKRSRAQKLTDDEATKLRAETERDEKILAAVRAELATLDKAIRERQAAVSGPSLAGALADAHNALSERYAERRVLEEEHTALNKELRRGRARLLRLEEAISMRLHLSGIDVTLCPNCEHDVPPEAITQEKETHRCRLCGILAESADNTHVVGLEAQHAALTTELDARTRARDELARRITEVTSTITTLMERSAHVQQAAAQGVTAALPTAEENAKREEFYERIGALRAALAIAREKLKGDTTRVDELKLRGYLIEKIRDALAEEAGARNASKLKRLAELTEQFAQLIGTESVSDVTCSPLGKVQLRKHGTPVSFTGIKNPGERLRVKMAFFLALAKLGREPEGARHPGLLLIDQPGSSEMIPADFANLATLFRQVEAEHSASVQILCFSARPELRTATVPEKVYGPQGDDGHAF